jgi:hypothetical protein
MRTGRAKAFDFADHDSHDESSGDRANDKFQEPWSAARSTLNMDLIQARVLQENLDVIERIDNLIMIAQRRIDEVIRELDRHRIMRRDASNFQVVERKMIEGKTTNKKVA